MAKIMFCLDQDGRLFFNSGVYLGDVLCDVDGFYKWWPANSGGFLDDYFLIAIGEFLLWLNKPWDDEINAYFEREARAASA